MSQDKKAFVQLHLAVFFFGFSAILGALISLPATVLVWWRLLITCISLLFLVDVLENFRKTDRWIIGQWMLIGLIVALHWITFFGSIKAANASVTLVCLATTSFHASWMEPVLQRKPINGFDILMGLMMVPGMYLVVQGIDVNMTLGFLLGMISAVLLALFGVLNKMTIDKGSPLFISFVELGSGWIFIGIYLLIFPLAWDQLRPAPMDWIYLLVLALFCTTWGYVLILKALRKVSAFTTMLAYNLEPVYGIVLAYLILGEDRDLSLSFYIGVVIIIAVIFLHPILKKMTSINHG